MDLYGCDLYGYYEPYGNHVLYDGFYMNNNRNNKNYESIFDLLLDSSASHKRFKIDLNNKSLWINKKEIILKGVIVNDKYKELPFITIKDLDMIIEDHESYLTEDKNAYQDIWSFHENVLYPMYKTSCPSERVVRSYFKSIPMEQLTEVDLYNGIDRNFATAIMGGFTLLAGLQGWMNWKCSDHWFYKGYDPDYVILKSWFSNNNYTILKGWLSNIDEDKYYITSNIVDEIIKNIKTRC